jgi:hypothetical protein
MDSQDSETCQEIVGKTVESVETGSSWVEIIFTDGSKILLSGRGSDERNWMEVN